MEETTLKQPVSLTFISTGTVKIRPSMRGQPATTFGGRSATLRRLWSFTDRKWSPDLPIGVFVVSHPDGPILFDTGESPKYNDQGYLPWWVPEKMVASYTITPDDGIVTQLAAHGIDPKSLKAIVISHLHGDHAGGLKNLAAAAPDVPVYVSRGQWDAFGNSRFQATFKGCAPQHWPKDFKPKTLEFTDHVVGPWKQSAKITPDGKVLAVPTPGHSPGHISLVVYGEDDERTKTTYFLPGMLPMLWIFWIKRSRMVLMMTQSRLCRASSLSKNLRGRPTWWCFPVTIRMFVVCFETSEYINRHHSYYICFSTQEEKKIRYSVQSFDSTMPIWPENRNCCLCYFLLLAAVAPITKP